MERSPMFYTLNERYKNKFVRKDQLMRFVTLGKITSEEYTLITCDVLE